MGRRLRHLFMFRGEVPENVSRVVFSVAIFTNLTNNLEAIIDYHALGPQVSGLTHFVHIIGTENGKSTSFPLGKQSCTTTLDLSATSLSPDV